MHNSVKTGWLFSFLIEFFELKKGLQLKKKNHYLRANNIGLMTDINPVIKKSSSGILPGVYRYTYVLNNPLKYTDPSGYTYYWKRFQWEQYVTEGMNFNAGAGGGSYINSIIYDPSYSSARGYHRRMVENIGPNPYWHHNETSGEYYNHKTGETVNPSDPDAINSMGIEHEKYLIYETAYQWDGNWIGTGKYGVIREGIMVSTGMFSTFSSQYSAELYKSNLNGESYSRGIPGESPVNMLTTSDPIGEILARVKFTEEYGGLTGRGLNEVIIQNGYATDKTWGSFHKKIHRDGRTFDLYLDVMANPAVDPKWYTITFAEFNYLNPGHSKVDPNYNQGYPYGFYALSGRKSKLIVIGAKSESDYTYLLNLYNSF